MGSAKDAQTPENARALDLCIIGGGPAGLTLAHALIGSGLEVLLIESGGETASSDANALSTGADTSGKFASLSLYRRRILGGASVIWGGRCVPYDPIDFEPRAARFGVGWPIPATELDPYYARAARYAEIGAPEFDARQALPGAADFIGGFASEVVQTHSFERFSPPTNFARTWGPQIKASANVRIETGATCVRLAVGAETDRVERAEFVRASGERFHVAARVYVVACGAIEVFRLLASSNDVHPNGLGNGSGALGRYFMSHIEGSIATLRLTDPKGRVEWGFPRSRDGVYGRRRMTIAPEVQRREGLLNFMMRLHHASPVDPRHGNAVLSAMFLAKSFILPEYRTKLTMVERVQGAAMPRGAAFWLAHLKNLVLGAPTLVVFAIDWFVRRYLIYRRIPYVALKSANGAYPIDFNAEQTPDAESRVRLSNEVDRNGVPLAVVDWRMNETDVASIARNFRIARDAFAASGAATLDFDDATLEARIREDAVPIGGHHIGLARMSADPSEGVVNADLRMHEVGNVYVAGGAVLPTSGHANPTLTIVALSVRLADHLKCMLGAAAK